MSGTGSGKTLKVFVVEDQARLLEQQVRLLRGVGGVQIVGTARDATRALAEIPAAAPDVVLLDLGLPGMDGIELTRRLRSKAPAIEVLVFTVFDEEDKVLDAIRAGAAGYLLKGTPADRVVEALREVAAGGSVVQPQLARRVLRRFQPTSSGGGSGEPRDDETRSLSPREREILGLIAKGLSNADVATALGLSRATVRTHLEHIYQKLDVSNRTEAVVKGIEMGLISAEDASPS